MVFQESRARKCNFPHLFFFSCLLAAPASYDDSIVYNERFKMGIGVKNQYRLVDEI